MIVPLIAIVAAQVQPAEAVVRDFLAAYARQDLSRIVALPDPAVTMTLPFAPGAPMLTGRDACAAYLADVFGKYRRITLSAVQLTPAADRRTVTVEAVAAFETPAGERHRVGYVWLITATGGRIVTARNYLVPIAEPAAAQE